MNFKQLDHPEKVSTQPCGLVVCYMTEYIYIYINAVASGKVQFLPEKK
jgi:hypothetical protein